MLTQRESALLATMWATEEWIIYERGTGYLGLSRVSGRTVFSLLRKCAISLEGETVGGVEHYSINETGQKLVRRWWGLEGEK